jgi:hypothetical protein
MASSLRFSQPLMLVISGPQQRLILENAASTTLIKGLGGAKKMKALRKSVVFAVLAVFVLLASGSAYWFYDGTLSHVTGNVKKADIETVPIEVDIGNLDSLQSFDTGVIDPSGYSSIRKRYSIQNMP